MTPDTAAADQPQQAGQGPSVFLVLFVLAVAAGSGWTVTAALVLAGGHLLAALTVFTASGWAGWAFWRVVHWFTQRVERALADAAAAGHHQDR